MPDKESQPGQHPPQQEKEVTNEGPPSPGEVIHIQSGYIQLRVEVLREKGEFDPEEVSELEGRVRALQHYAELMGINPETGEAIDPPKHLEG